MISKLVTDTYFYADPASVTLYRYDDPILGPRTKPVATDILRGMTEIPSDSVFSVNTETQNVEINVAGSTYKIDQYLIYIDTSRGK